MPKYTGKIRALLGERIGNKGTFKTAHPGYIMEMNPCDPLQDTHPPAANFFNPANHKDDHMVCIKQLYKQHNSGQGIQHLQGADEAKEIFGEALCLLFAGALLDMSYAFMD